MATKAFHDDIKAKLSKVAKSNDGAANGNELQKLKAEYAELMQNAESEPTQRLFKTNETSIQSMTVLQNQNPRGILLVRSKVKTTAFQAVSFSYDILSYDKPKAQEY